MRAALWLLALFGVAVAVALFAGNNQGTVTCSGRRTGSTCRSTWCCCCWSAAFVVPACRAAARWPRCSTCRARRCAGARSRRSAPCTARCSTRCRTCWPAASSAPASRPRRRWGRRDRCSGGGAAAGQRGAGAHAGAPAGRRKRAGAAGQGGARGALRQALEQASSRDAQETREGALMRAARWALDDREPDAAMAWLKGLPQGAARRTLALRMKLKAARLAQPHRGSAGDRAPAGQAPGVLTRRRAEHRARTGGRPAQRRARRRPAAARLGHRWSPPSARCRSWRSTRRSASPRWAAMRIWRATGCCRCGSSRRELGDGLRVKLVRRAGGRPGQPGRRLAGAHRSGAEGQSARCHAAVPGRHGLHEAPALGQGAAAAEPGGAGPAGRETAPQCLARAGAAGRGTRRRTKRRPQAWKRAASD